MSKTVKIITPEFESKLSSIETKVQEIKDLISSIDDEMSKVDGTHTTIWSGKAQDILYNHYKNVFGKFPNTEKTLDEYITFLKNTVELYKQEEKTLETSVNNNEDELSVV